MLIKKYGVGGTHLTAQQQAIGRLAVARRRPEPMAPLPRPPKPAKRGDEEADAPAKGRRKPRAESPAAEAPAETAPVEQPAQTEPAATEEQG